LKITKLITNKTTIMSAQNNLIIVTGSVKQRRAQINKSSRYQDQSGMFKSRYQYNTRTYKEIWFRFRYFFSLPWCWWYYWLCHIFSHACFRKLRVSSCFSGLLLVTILVHGTFSLFFKRNHVSNQDFFSWRIFATSKK
jgi:hypothetical protein